MSTDPPQPTGPDETPALSDEEEALAARNANRFDIRRLIGGLFVLYGVILTITGIVGHITSRPKRPGSTSTCGPGSGC